VPVATDSTQEYRELRELLDTGSSGAGAATAEAAEKKQALMVFGGAAAVVLLVIIGLVAFPKDDGKGKASSTAADKTGVPAGDAAGNGATSTTPTTAPAPPLEAPAGTKAGPYEVLSSKVLAGLKAGDRVDFLNGPDVVARNILVLAVGEEQDILAGFKQRVVTIAATDDERATLLSVTISKRSMTQASGEPAPTTPPPSG
jgi:hypothetical protein